MQLQQSTNLGFPQFVNFLFQLVAHLLIWQSLRSFQWLCTCPYQYDGGPDQLKINSNFHFHVFGHFCAKKIFFTFSSFCLDVIFSTNSWPSRIATSRDLDFQFMLVELISKLQIQILAARIWILSLKMVVFVCLMVMTLVLTEPPEVGRAPWSYRTAIKSNIRSNQ